MSKKQTNNRGTSYRAVIGALVVALIMLILSALIGERTSIGVYGDFLNVGFGLAGVTLSIMAMRLIGSKSQLILPCLFILIFFYLGVIAVIRIALRGVWAG